VAERPFGLKRRSNNWWTVAEGVLQGPVNAELERRGKASNTGNGVGGPAGNTTDPLFGGEKGWELRDWGDND